MIYNNICIEVEIVQILSSPEIWILIKLDKQVSNFTWENSNEPTLGFVSRVCNFAYGNLVSWENDIDPLLDL